MKFYINQTIVIHTIRIAGISNSSVFQIGSSGQIQPLSNLYNSGGFTEPAPLPAEEPVVPPVSVPLRPPT
ncbi:spore germination protein GerPB [Aureibacillus halotolerans]|uniref:Spore germination protein PB n=1 Tax=Aureibacillus halotolerans TaxID=1508390 RepID=A0A4R6U6E5_9BACI|nr:spore germination protein GerPB [Aureibacillus halotolerans]TDQ42078.1 spore germination protein PB [Aureibacillus halotolerans]